MLSLKGLNPKDRNNMISDHTSKDKRQPILCACFHEVIGGKRIAGIQRWVWDEDDVSSMDIIGNILRLLSSKMSGLSSSIQLALKIAACFGIKIKQSVVAASSTHLELSNIQDKLKQVLKEGFMIKVGNFDFKFVHDKVREAAYSLIPKKDKDQVSRAVEQLYNVQTCLTFHIAIIFVCHSTTTASECHYIQ
jgi:hypothetical protein